MPQRQQHRVRNAPLFRCRAPLGSIAFALIWLALTTPVAAVPGTGQALTLDGTGPRTDVGIWLEHASGVQVDKQGAGRDIGACEFASAFSIEERDGASWLVRPDGRRFFSLGVCVVDQGASRPNYDSTNPGYAAFQHYADSNQWAAATWKRLQSWNFTTLGGWSDFAAFQRCDQIDVAFTPVLHVGSTAGVPWWDMWDPNIIARIHEVARAQILPIRDDPRLLGYYSDNEIG
jgi:hypothetical protein